MSENISEIEAENASLRSTINQLEDLLGRKRDDDGKVVDHVRNDPRPPPDQDRLLRAPESRMQQSLIRIDRVSEEISSLKVALHAKDAELLNAADRLEEKNKFISERDVTVAERDKTIQALVDLKQKPKGIFDLAEKLGHLETTVRENETRILGLTRQLEDSKTKGNKEAEILEQTGQLQDTKTTMSEKDIKILELTVQLKDRKIKMCEQETKTLELAGQLKDLQTKVLEQDAAIQEQDLVIADMTSKLEIDSTQRRAMQVELEDEARAKDVEIAGLEREKESLEARITGGEVASRAGDVRQRRQRDPARGYTEQCALISQQMETFQKVVDRHERKEREVTETIREKSDEIQALEWKLPEQAETIREKIGEIPALEGKLGEQTETIREKCDEIQTLERKLAEQAKTIENTKRIGAIYFEETQSSGVLAFVEAAEEGKLETVEAFIAMGLDLDARDKQGSTPLCWASFMGHLSVVKSLLSAGANVDAQDGQEWAPLHFASLNGHLEVVKALLNAGANVDMQNRWGYTPLHWASLSGKVEVVKVLLDAGANKNLKSDWGETPRDVALVAKRGVLEKLLD